ncbi:MAG: hypothetical protein V3V88_02965 [Dehalococcoidia bacterium]
MYIKRYNPRLEHISELFKAVLSNGEAILSECSKIFDGIELGPPPPLTGFSLDHPKVLPSRYPKVKYGFIHWDCGKYQPVSDQIWTWDGELIVEMFWVYNREWLMRLAEEE